MRPADAFGLALATNVAIAFGLLASGCAQQITMPARDSGEVSVAESEENRLLDLSLDRWVERSSRLQRVSQLLRIAGRELCDDAVSPVLGAAVQDLSALPNELNDVARGRYGSDNGLIVLSVFPEIGVDPSGLQPADQLLALGGRGVDEVAGSTDSFRHPFV